MNPTSSPTPPSPFDILAHVPVWVWAILALILVLGGQQSREQLVGRPGC